MRKIITLVAALLIMAATAKAQTQPINVVCNSVSTDYYVEDNDLYVQMFSTDFEFYFDIYCAQGATDIVDGQTYTLADMYISYSYGVDYATYIDYQSVSFVRYADGSYVVDVTDVDGNQYHITYTVSEPLTPDDVVDTVAVTMDNGRVNKVIDVTSTQGAFQLLGADAADQYEMSLAVYSDQIAGTYTIDDVYLDYTSISVNGVYVGVNTINNSFTVTGDTTACSTYVEIIGEDSVLYQITFSYPGVVPDPFDTIDITMNSASNSIVDYTSFMGLFVLDGFDQAEEYELYLAVNSDQIAGSYTQDDVNKNYTYFSHNEERVGILEISDFTVTGNSRSCSTYVEIVGSNNILYRINYSYTKQAIVPTDTVDITMDNAAINEVNDLTKSQGMYQLIGADQGDEYEMYLAVLADQIAGTYTQDDVYGYYTGLYYDDSSIEIDEIRDFTVTGNAKSCSTYVEIVSTDAVLYKITYSYTYVPLETKDTINITMDNGRYNSVNDVTAKGVFQLFGADATNQYAMQLTVYSDQMAGTYTFDDIYSSLTYFYANGATVGISNVNDFTVTGDSTACSAYIEIIGEDSVLYQVTFSYPGVIHAPSDTIDITMNSASNIFEDYISSMSLFRLHGYDQTGDYELYLAVNSNQIAGSYTQDDVNMKYSGFYHNDNYVGFYEVSNFTVTGNAKSCSTYVEILGRDNILYRINYSYTKQAIVPTDTVNITMDNAEFNAAYDQTYAGLFQLYGADQNDEYRMHMVIYSDQMANTYTQSDVEMTYSYLQHCTAEDTASIEIEEIRDFTVTGDEYDCNAYIEIISTDSVLYRITYTYSYGIKDTVDIVMDNKNNQVSDKTATDGYFLLVGADQAGEYLLALLVGSDQMAGTYGAADIVDYEFVSISGTDTSFIQLERASIFTVDGDSTWCKTELVFVSADSVMYRITFEYSEVPVGVENTVGETEFVVCSESNTIVVYGVEGQMVAVYDMAGRTIMNGESTSDIKRIDVAVPGIYVVRVADKAVKVLVK